MTDKQIIIDGVNVAECENLMQGIVPFGCMEDRKTCSCMNNPNCLYKQLKRKEQECEKLKIFNSMLNSALGHRRAGKKTYIDLSVELDKLKQTLTEIKEIANYSFNLSTSKLMAKLELILQKISEVE